MLTMDNTSVSIKVQKATLKDLDQLAILFDGYRMFYEKESDLEGCIEFLTARIKNKESVIFIAKSGDELLMGFLQLYPIFSSTRMKRLWLLNDLYVTPTFRGLKVSVALIDKAKRMARETNSAGLILETSKSNEIGNTLYLKNDFTLDAEYNYYSWA
jgi:GNAT superfamily N-acetyltransferase